MFRVRRLIKSFKYAFRGFVKTFREEQNLQIQSLAGLATVCAGFFFGLERLEWIFIIFVVVLVMLMELANSAVERIADILKPRLDNYVKEIKDISAAAVLLSSVLAVFVGIMVFWPYIKNYFLS